MGRSSPSKPQRAKLARKVERHSGEWRYPSPCLSPRGTVYQSVDGDAQKRDAGNIPFCTFSPAPHNPAKRIRMNLRDKLKIHNKYGFIILIVGREWLRNETFPPFIRTQHLKSHNNKDTYSGGKVPNTAPFQPYNSYIRTRNPLG